MSELFLIAHKVRGEPAFDIAQQIEVNGDRWWIIPTSGHRAHPWKYQSIDSLCDTEGMPNDLPDHYTSKEAARHPKINLDDLEIDL